MTGSITKELKMIKKTLLEGWQGLWPIVKSTVPLATGEGVIDQSAFNTIEIDKLFDALNNASMTIGEAVQYRSLTQPLDNLDEIKLKQDAVKEIQSNPALKEGLENIIKTAASRN